MTKSQSTIDKKDCHQKELEIQCFGYLSEDSDTEEEVERPPVLKLKDQQRGLSLSMPLDYKDFLDGVKDKSKSFPVALHATFAKTKDQRLEYSGRFNRSQNEINLNFFETKGPEPTPAPRLIRNARNLVLQPRKRRADEPQFSVEEPKRFKIDFTEEILTTGFNCCGN